MTLNDPQTQSEIEAALRLLVETDRAETGLYDMGLSYVVVDRVGPDNQILFTWFDQVLSFDQVLHDAKQNESR